MTRSILSLTVLAVFLGCATTPTPDPLPSRLVELGPGDSLKVDHVVLVSDGSHSMTEDDLVGQERLLAESFVSGMPEGSYTARGILFGGNTRKATAGSAFDRNALGNWASSVRYLAPTTPLADALGAAGSGIEGRQGNAAIVLFSDGIATWGDPDAVIAKARDVGKAYPGQLCIYTVQVGNDPEGKRLLESLASATGCGGSTNGSALQSASAMNDFQRAIFVTTAVAEAPRMAPPAPGLDPCAGVLRLRGVNFAFDKANIRPEDEVLLDEAARMLEMCGSKRVRIEGHTDATGPEAYNQGLSQRRAQSVLNYLVGKGVASSRLQAAGLGESQPVASNATREGRALNRRVDFKFLQ
jgi:OOP family OmpA-OmpF porin